MIVPLALILPVPAPEAVMLPTNLCLSADVFPKVRLPKPVKLLMLFISEVAELPSILPPPKSISPSVNVKVSAAKFDEMFKDPVS